MKRKLKIFERGLPIVLIGLTTVILDTFNFKSVQAVDLGQPPSGIEVSVGETIEDKVDYANTLLKDLDKKMGEKGTSAVTIVTSGNAKIEGTDIYYQPKLEDLENLEEIVLSKGFSNAYTGFFDLSRKQLSVRDPKMNRALNIIGFDFLLTHENFSNGKHEFTKISSLDSVVPKNVAMMDIFKALGQEEIRYDFVFKSKSKSEIYNTPAIKDLPNLVNHIDTKRGETIVYATRSHISDYTSKAVNLGFSHDSVSSAAITGGEFIMLLKDLMDYYGEPRLSQKETYQLLQVYGDNMPTYLSAGEKDAYMYLKSRGVLANDDDGLNFSGNLTYRQMLPVLMRAADVNSRENYKEIQLTLDIGDDLVEQGYFPKTVSLASKEDAIQVKTEYSYRNAEYYDYFIEISNTTKFRDESGAEVDTLFIPSQPMNTSSVCLSGFTYKGIEVSLDGSKQYYHFTQAIIPENDSYFAQTGYYMKEIGWMQLNTRSDSDRPLYIWFKQGGGVYSADSSTGEVSDGVVAVRRAFKDGEFEECVDQERRSGDSAQASIQGKDKSFLASLLQPITVNAAQTGVNIRVTIYQWHNVLPTWIIPANLSTVIEVVAESKPGINEGDYKVFEMQAKEYKHFLASIERDKADTTTVSTVGIASLSGDKCLIDYDYLVDKEVCYLSEAGDLPQVESNNNNILVIDTQYGRVVLNQERHQILVGSTLYNVPVNTTLFKYLVENGENKLYIDFRAVYGWTDNIINCVMIGNGSNYQIEIEERDTSVEYRNTVNIDIKAPDSFRTSSMSQQLEYAQILEKGIAGNNEDIMHYLAVSNYALSNWLVFQGQKKDYLFVFFGKEAVESIYSGFKDESEKISGIVGYSIKSDGWVCRVVELNRVISSKPGQFSYVEPYGYIYNMPEYADFTMEKYVKGEYLLPLTFDGNKTKIYNMNVNYFTKLPWGVRPVLHVQSITPNMNIVQSVVDIKGEDINIAGIPYGYIQVKAAPAAVHTLFGGYIRNNISPSAAVGVFQGNKFSTAYLGTSGLTIASNSRGTSKYVEATMSFSDKKHPFTMSTKLNEAIPFYQVHKKKNLTHGSNVYNYVYMAYTEMLVETELPVSEQIEDDEGTIVVVDAEAKDKFLGFDEFSLKHTLEWLDNSSSFIILFVMRVFPYLGILFLTMLLGLASISKVKIVQKVFEKTIDPVKVITFGKMVYRDLEFKKVFVGVLIGYCAFTMLLDGNILRLIIWGSEMFSVITDMLWQV